MGSFSFAIDQPAPSGDGWRGAASRVVPSAEPDLGRNDPRGIAQSQDAPQVRETRRTIRKTQLGRNARPDGSQRLRPFDDPFGDAEQLQPGSAFADPFGDGLSEESLPAPAEEVLPAPLDDDYRGYDFQRDEDDRYTDTQPDPDDRGYEPGDLLPPREDFFRPDALGPDEQPEDRFSPYEDPPSIPDGMADDRPFGPATTPEEEGRQEHERECRQSLEYLQDKQLSEIDLNINIIGVAGKDFPRVCDLDTDSVPLSELDIKDRTPVHVAWTASGLCHKPTYFGQNQVERYGHSAGPFVQPLISAGHFFATLPILPYKMGLRPPNECVYALGHYRPGSCAPYLIPAVPISVRAGLSQAGAVIGAAYVLP